MKKRKKTKGDAPVAPVNTKGKKLAYAPLRTLVLDTMERNPGDWNARSLIKRLKIANNKTDVERVLDALTKQNKLTATRDGNFKALGVRQKSIERTQVKQVPSTDLKQGRVDMTRSGSAYVIVQDMEEDVFVSQKYTNGAMHRDTVEIELLPPRKGKKPEGRVVNVVKRAIEQVVGTMKLYKKFAVVVPDRVNIQFDVVVPIEKMNEAVDGDKVVVKITDWNQQPPTGEVVQVLGASGSHELEMQSILIHNGFNLAWPEKVIDECKQLPEHITEEEIARRKDFRKITTFTIDPITAKDFDDALSYRVLDNGNIEVGVHIADVSHYVLPGTALDKEAYLRSTSVYLVDRVCPMLPEKLSNELCSLRPLEESLCYSAVFEIDPDNKVVHRWFGRTIIYSDHRFSYEDAQVVLDGEEGPFATELRKLNKIAKALRKKRIKDGAIMFETDELQFKVDELGETLEIFVKERKDAHLLIEEFMLLANREVATLISQKGKSKEIPFPYRVHDLPDPDRLIDFQRFARELGFQIQIDTPKQIAKSFNRLAEAAETNDTLRLLEPLAIRTMAKAIYTTNNIGHYGLAFDYYTHFTSPIRRYADVLVHRILDANLKEVHREEKSTLESRCKHISDMERAAMNAERESVKYKQMEFLKNKVGQEFLGVVSGVIEAGIFVELEDSKAEGMIAFRNMHGGYYQTAPYKAGSRTGDVISIGQKVNVRIKKIDMGTRQMDLELVGEERLDESREQGVRGKEQGARREERGPRNKASRPKSKK